MSIYIGDKEIKNLCIGDSSAKAVYLGDIKVRPPVPATVTVTDSNNATAQYQSRTSGYYYGITFTALKSGKILKVGFIYTGPSATGVLKIAQGAYASVAGTTYNYSTSNGEFELDTPYEITAGNVYTVSINTGNSNTFGYQNSGSYPITGTAVRYDYTTYSTSNTAVYNAIYAIKSLTIEYTP